MRLEGTIPAPQPPRRPATRVKPATPRRPVAYLTYLWAAPTSSLGLLSLLLASAARPFAGRVGTQMVDGVLEI
ncbi:MAG: hypothetical protein KY463_15875, partial [Actinobacteria bacterium]|nr:hypothetical protein [Actinomycetota bacterium]